MTGVIGAIQAAPTHAEITLSSLPNRVKSTEKGDATIKKFEAKGGNKDICYRKICC